MIFPKKYSTVHVAFQFTLKEFNGYKKVKIAKVRLNDWNPNEVPKILFDSLVSDVRRDGGNQHQPIIVREMTDDVGKYYEVIDGAHRFMACKELGLKEVYITVRNDLGDAEARIKTIAMNRFRGEFDYVELGVLVNSLMKDYGMTEAEVKQRMGVTDTEMGDFRNIADFDFDSFNDVQLPPSEDFQDFSDTIVKTKEPFVVGLTEEMMKEVEEFFENNKEMTREDAFTEACRRTLLSFSTND